MRVIYTRSLKLIVGILSALIILRMGLGFVSLNIGGGKLYTAVERAKNHNSDPYPCMPEIMSTEQDQLLNSAANWLANSRQVGFTSQSSLLLGRTFCWLGKNSEALRAYQEYTNLRPDNPLGHLELGFAYQQACLLNEIHNDSYYTATDGTWCSDSVNTANMIQEWNAAGVTASQFLESANRLFSEGDFILWQRYYLAALTLGIKPQPVDLFHAQLVSIAKTHEGFNSRLIADIPIYLLDGRLEISAKNMVSGIGKPLSTSTDQEYPYAVLWRNGPIYAVVRVSEPGKFRVVVRMFNSVPPPISLRLECDLEAVQTFNLNRGDNTWEDLQAELMLSSGLHLIALNFLNDAQINGVDRNAIIESIRIEKVSFR